MDWPSIIVEAGFVTASPAEASTSLKLNDATNGKLDTNTLSGASGGSVSWVDITDFVRTFETTRTGTRQQGPLWQWEAGTVTINLDNAGGQFDPDNLSGPYMNSDGTSQVDVMVPLRVKAEIGGQVLAAYTGYADSWTPDPIVYEGDYATLTVSGTDAFKILNNIQLAELGAAEGVNADTGARVVDILSRVGWYTSAEWSSIDTGLSLLQGTTLGNDALTLCQSAATSEIGRLFVDENGAINFKNRHSLLTDPRSVNVQAVFGDVAGTVHDAGTELTCAAINRVLDDTTFANDIQATTAGGTLQEVQDAASVAKYKFPRTYQQTDLELLDDASALSWARWVLYVAKTGENRIDSIDIDPTADPDNLWPQIFQRKVGDRIQVWCRPPSFDTPIVRDCFIVGISHVCDATQYTWTTTFQLQDATKYADFLVLNNPQLGALNENAVAY